MSNRDWVLLALALNILLYGAVNAWRVRPVPTGPGVLAPLPPIQRNLPASEQRTMEFNGSQITALAEFSLAARILSRQDYTFDTAAALAPTDLALGWGHMSDKSVIEQFSISQDNRFFFWSYEGDPPLPEDEIISSCANMHLIPASPEVRSRIAAARPGQVVNLRGYLVHVERGDWTWQSSLSRDDTGDGACEVVWVKEFEAKTVTGK